MRIACLLVDFLFELLKSLRHHKSNMGFGLHHFSVGLVLDLVYLAEHLHPVVLHVSLGYVLLVLLEHHRAQ